MELKGVERRRKKAFTLRTFGAYKWQICLSWQIAILTPTFANHSVTVLENPVHELTNRHPVFFARGNLDESRNISSSLTLECSFIIGPTKTRKNYSFRFRAPDFGKRMLFILRCGVVCEWESLRRSQAYRPFCRETRLLLLLG